MKPYYTDPLAAAWMAKHFGMRFTYSNNDDGDIGENGLEDFLMEYGDRKLAWFYEKLYIATDSLHLLEPMINDLVANPNFTRPWRVCGSDIPTKAGPFQGSWPHDDFISLDRAKGNRIIERDGKPFHWPEYA